jgi:hypothetical protein
MVLCARLPAGRSHDSTVLMLTSSKTDSAALDSECCRFSSSSSVFGYASWESDTWLAIA